MAGVPSSSSANVCSLAGAKFSSIWTIKWDLKVGDKIDFVAFVSSQRAPTKEEVDGTRSVFLRILKLVDKNHDEIEMFVRGTGLTENSIPDHCVLAVQNAVVQRTNGKKSLRCLWISVQINPPIAKAKQLRETIANDKSAVYRIDHCENLVLTPISEILEKGKYRDQPNVAGLVIKREPPTTRKTRAGQMSWMRVVFVADSETSVIKLTVWGFEVQHRDIPLYTVICARKTTLYDSETTKTLSCLSTQVQIDPDLPQTEELNKLVSYFSKPKEKADLNVAATPQPPQSPLRQAPCSSFTSIQDIKTKNSRRSRPSLAGIVINVEPAQQRQTKSGQSTWLKRLEVADDAGSSIKMSIWGPRVKTLEIPIKSVIRATDVTIRDYHGDVSVDCLVARFEITSDFPEAEEIKKRTANYCSNPNVKSKGNETLKDDKCGYRQNKAPESLKYTSIKELLENRDFKSKYSLVVKRLEPELQSSEGGKQSWRREIVITDDNVNKVGMNIWGEKVIECDVPLYSVISAQQVIIRQFKGKKKLSCLWAQLGINPLIPQIDELKKLTATYLERHTNRQVSKPHQCRKPNVKIVFTPFENILSNNDEKLRYNVLGSVVAFKPTKTVKTGKKILYVKVLTVIDEKPTQMNMAVWGHEFMGDDILLHSVIIAKNVKLERHKERFRLSCFRSVMKIEPSIAEIDKLREMALTYKLIPRFLFPSEFHRISEIKKAATVGSQWDIIGFVNKIYDSTKLPSGNGGKGDEKGPMLMHQVRIKDSRRNLLCLSIWDNQGKKREIEEGSIIAVKGAIVREFNGKLTFNTYWKWVEINPDIPAVESLKQFKKDDDGYRNLPDRLINDEQYGDYTPFEMIIRRNAPTQPFHIIGLVVKVDEEPLTEEVSEGRIVKNCVLRDRNGIEISLQIHSTRKPAFPIPTNCLVTVRNARLSKNENLLLTCDYSNIVFNIDLYYNLDIPEVKGFKDAAISASVQHEEPEAPMNFTAFSEIDWRTSLGKAIRIVGLVVHIIERDELHLENPQRLRKDTRTLRVTLRDKNRDLISLIIKETPESEIDAVPLHSVISVQDAILRASYSDRMLWCCWKNLKINPDIPEKEELEKLRELPFEGDFMPFKVIHLARDDLIEYNMDIIGHVVKILGIKFNKWRNTVHESSEESTEPSQTQQNEIETENVEIQKEDYSEYYLEVLLRNEIDLKLRILGLPQRLHDLEGILLNRIISAREAKLVVQKWLPNKFEENETVLETDSSLVEIDPKIAENVRGAKAVKIVPIEQIHSKAQVGDVVGLLAIVVEFPKRIYPWVNDPSLSEESEDDVKETVKKYTLRRVKLLDSSGKEIPMLIPMSVVASLRGNKSEIVVVLARNLRVFDFNGKLEVEYTPLSLIKINPKIEQSETLLKWYKQFRTMKIKELRAPKLSIKAILENAFCHKIVSIIGILVDEYWREELIGNVKVWRRRIKIVDDSKEMVRLRFREQTKITHAVKFDIPLFSVVMVENLLVRNDDPSKIEGTVLPDTRFVVNPSDPENSLDTLRLMRWFPGFWKDLKKPDVDNEAVLPGNCELQRKQRTFLKSSRIEVISKENKEEESARNSNREIEIESEFSIEDKEERAVYSDRGMKRKPYLWGHDNDAGCAGNYPQIHLWGFNQAEGLNGENAMECSDESSDMFTDF